MVRILLPSGCLDNARANGRTGTVADVESEAAAGCRDMLGNIRVSCAGIMDQVDQKERSVLRKTFLTLMALNLAS
jgi:hypothetical protein